MIEEKIIGLSLEEAEKVAKKENFVIRVTSRDGEHFAMTMDYRLDRINVSVKDGIVVSVGRIG